MAASRVNEILQRDKSPSKSDAALVLDILRNSNLHRPALVLQLGDLALSTYGPTYREYWDIAAAICRAAFECGEVEIAEAMLRRIMRQFPKSSRTHMLNGIYSEMKGAYNRAMSIYIRAIDEQPMSPHLYKRQVAVLKSELKFSEAAALLNYYLSMYSNDTDSWAELCALCLRLGRLSHALFAASELAIHDHANHAYHTLLADVYITCGTTTHNLNMARSHYVASVNARTHGNLRALYGIWLTCNMLLDGDMIPDQHQRNECDKLLSHAKAAISAVYMSAQNSNRHQNHEHVHDLLKESIDAHT